jgi:hypothetical protein
MLVLGWSWSQAERRWYLPGSRRRPRNAELIARTASQLGSLGNDVEVIDGHATLTSGDAVTDVSVTKSIVTSRSRKPATVVKLLARLNAGLERINAALAGSEDHPPVTGQQRSGLLNRKATLVDEIAVWSVVHEDNIRSGKISAHTMLTINVGDRVRVGDDWYTVTHRNTDRLKLRSEPGEFASHVAPYEDITEHQPRQRLARTIHPSGDERKQHSTERGNMS